MLGLRSSIEPPESQNQNKNIGAEPQSEEESQMPMHTPKLAVPVNAHRRPLKARLFSAVAGSVHGVVDEQDYNDST